MHQLGDILGIRAVAEEEVATLDELVHLLVRVARLLLGCGVLDQFVAKWRTWYHYNRQFMVHRLFQLVQDFERSICNQHADNLAIRLTSLLPFCESILNQLVLQCKIDLESNLASPAQVLVWIVYSYYGSY